MKKLLFIAILAGAAWWYFVGGRSITEAQVNDFYRATEAATLARKPDDLCNLLAEDFTSSGTVALGGQRRAQSQSKSQVCEGYVALYEAWDKLGEKMGGTLQLDSTYEIHSIEVAPDKKTAKVDISSSLDVAGSLTNIRSRSTDTLVRRGGKVLLLRSEGTASVGAGS